MPLKTDTFLRRAERDDLDTIVSWMDDPDFLFFLYGDPLRSPRQVREHIVSMLGRSVGHTMPGGIYLLIDSEEHGPIGLISLQNISWRNRSCNIDFYIGRKELRSSITTAISYYRLLEYCFDELNLHRVAAFIYSFNTASWRIMERSGAKLEMVLKDHIERDGEYHDMHCYGMLRNEFDEARDRETNIKFWTNAGLKAMIKQQKTAPASSEQSPENAK